MNVSREVMVGRGGLEPPTSRLSGVRSNHLSYRPGRWKRPDKGAGLFRRADARHSRHCLACLTQTAMAFATQNAPPERFAVQQG